MTPHTTTRCATALLALMILGGCGRRGEPEVKTPPTLDVTSWTTKSELFMEYPPFVAGRTARFAVHLTQLADFKALNAGTPSIEFLPEAGGAPVVLAGTPPLRPGAFRVEGTIPPAGRYRWTLKVDAPNLSDRHDLGVATVFADEAAANADAEKQHTEDPSAIAYLKEQQWTNVFATVQVRESELRTAVRAPATIAPVAGGEAIVSAPAAGRFAAESLPNVGAAIGAGQQLGRLEPRLGAGEDRAGLGLEVTQAEVSLEAATAEQTRAERLLAERAVPARRVEDARRAVTAAQARVQTARARLAQRDETLRTGGGAGNAFLLRSPIEGRVVEVFATLGASFEEGAPLFRVVRTDRVEVRVHVPASDAPTVRQTSDLAFETPGVAEPIPLRPQRVHDSGVIDPKTAALPVVFEVDNAGGRLLIGQTGSALLYKRERRSMPAVPKAAVLTEAGRPYVWIQVGGERFVRRYIEVAGRDGDIVGVASGLRSGDRVVVRGAYDVQLASAAKGLAAEGHVH